jgi:hypothetical protein
MSKSSATAKKSVLDLVGILRSAQAGVLDEAVATLGRSHLEHYQRAGAETSRRRLGELYALVSDCVAQRTLMPMIGYGESVARDRFSAGFEITEVQTAFNVLEEAIWRVVIPGVPVEELAEATGLIGTVLGAGKDALARAWVSMATSQHVASLDLTALFQGASS